MINIFNRLFRDRQEEDIVIDYLTQVRLDIDKLIQGESERGDKLTTVFTAIQKRLDKLEEQKK